MTIFRATLIVSSLALSLLAAASASQAESPAPASDTRTAGAHVEFLEKALQYSLAEIELGRLARTNAQSMGINALGTRIARDHTRMRTMLGLIARDKGVAVVDSLDTRHRAVVDGLKAKTGAEFDAAYASLMVSNHEKAIALFAEAARSDDPDVAEFAKRALPSLREEKRLAVSYQKMTSNYELEPVATRD
jgi:putative membrane protein